MSGKIYIWNEITSDTRKLMITNEDPESRSIQSFKFDRETSTKKSLYPPECVVINFFGHPELEIENLEDMPRNFTNLESLKIKKIKSLRGMPKDLPHLKSLSIIDLNLKFLDDFPKNLSNLEGLGISCPNLKNFLGISQNLPNLKRLLISGKSLESLKGIPQDFPKLEKIRISNTNIRNLEFFPANIPYLKEIILVRNKLVSLKGLPSHIPVLNKLDLSYNHLASLEDISHHFGKRNPSIRVRENPIRTLAGIKNRPLFERLVGFGRNSYCPHVDISTFQLCPAGIKLINDYHQKRKEQFNKLSKYQEREEFNAGFINSLSHLYDDVEMPTAEDFRRSEREIPALKTAIIEYYRKTPMELAQQYAENPESLTKGELERLGWEGGYQERQLLESNLSLGNDCPNSVLEEISKRLTHQLSSGLSILK